MVLQARTREQLRQSVGYNLPAGTLFVGSATSNGDTTSLIDTKLTGPADEHNGKWVRFTGATNDEVVREVSDFASNDATLTPALSAGTVSGDTYELWAAQFSPVRIDEYINQAIIEATKHVYDPEESLALYSYGRQRRFDIPTEFAMLNRVEYRHTYVGKTVLTCDSRWDELVDADVTASLDDEDKRQSSGSAKFVVGAGIANGDRIATDSIASLDMSRYTHIEFWMKVETAVALNDLALLLDNTAQSASPLETLNIPALSARTWTYVRIALANPEDDTAIISVGLEYNANAGANTVWIDDIKIVDEATSQWAKIPSNQWHIDHEERDIVFKNTVPVGLLKLKGGDKPALLTDDDTTTEVPDDFIIAYATALAFNSVAGSRNPQEDGMARQAAMWFGNAERARRKFPILQDIRVV